MLGSFLILVERYVASSSNQSVAITVYLSAILVCLMIMCVAVQIVLTLHITLYHIRCLSSLSEDHIVFMLLWS